MFNIATHTIALNEFDTNTDHLTAEEMVGLTTAELIADEVADRAYDLIREMDAAELMAALENCGYDIEAPRCRDEDEYYCWVDYQMDWMADTVEFEFTVQGDKVVIELAA